MKSRILFWFLGLTVILGSCHSVEEEPLPKGSLIKSTGIADYDTVLIRRVTREIEDIGPLSIKYNVKAVRILYLTGDAEGNTVTVSGLLMVPLSGGSFPLLSVQHGTIINRNKVSSVDPLLNEGVVGLIAASEGYVACIPDYLGLGVSGEMHPYLVGDVLAGNVADMIPAVKTYMKDHGMTCNGELFLAGYSEGGYVTMAAHRALEEGASPAGVHVAASAPMAGPYDLKTTIDTILSYGSYQSPAFIAYFLTAYNKVYGWNRLHEIFREPYASMMSGLFDGTHSTGEINKILPEEIDSLLTRDFLEAYLSGDDPDLTAALEENTLLGWGPEAPVRMYHGDNDHTVPYRNSVRALEDLRQHGGTHVELVTIHGGDHGSSVVPSFTGALHWFDSLRTAGR